MFTTFFQVVKQKLPLAQRPGLAAGVVDNQEVEEWIKHKQKHPKVPIFLINMSKENEIPLNLYNFVIWKLFLGQSFV